MNCIECKRSFSTYKSRGLPRLRCPDCQKKYIRKRKTELQRKYRLDKIRHASRKSDVKYVRRSGVSASTGASTTTRKPLSLIPV